MVLTRNFSATLNERVAYDPAFAKALLDEAEMLFLKGDARVARRVFGIGQFGGTRGAHGLRNRIRIAKILKHLAKR
jgi:hypothetical protein